ncbi:MAG: hypothetical protein Q8L88_13385 [Bacteroidota bacterium]|nr:hypothetical protein [Bacteroidota bacterium]
MKKIRAFVGHSFLEKDKAIVECFLKYFGTLSDSVDFEWEHAEKAAPDGLAEKVKSKMQNKNLFIGICTAKEKSIDPLKLKNGLFRKKRLYGNEEDFSWQTSGWILQELGYAIGKDMEILLIIEDQINGIHGLHGDLEYISFSRNNPSDAFQKILQMISALTPQENKMILEVPQESRKNAGDKEMVESGAQDLLADTFVERQKKWSADDYENEILTAIIKNDHAREEEIFNNYLRSDLAPSDKEKINWTAKRFFYRSLNKIGTGLADLRDLAERNPTNYNANHFLSLAYEHLEEYKLANKFLFKSIDLVSDKEEKLSLNIKSASLLVKDGDFNGARNAVKKILNTLPSDIKQSNELLILNTLIEIEKSAKNIVDFLAYGESVLKINPEEDALRFSMAYQYAEQKNHGLAIYHYKFLTQRRNSDGDWNNLGVSYSNLNLNGKAVNAYQESEKLNGTLAMSNIAYKYLHAGFFKEADSLCKKAITVKDYNQNINNCLVKLNESSEDEEKRETELLQKLNTLRDNLSEYSKSCITKGSIIPNGKWKSEKCTIIVTANNSTFKGVGSYFEEKKGVGFALKKLSQSLSGEPQVDNITLYFEGSVLGNGIKYKLITKDSDDPSRNKEEIGFMIYYETEKKIKYFTTNESSKEFVNFLEFLGE